MSEAWTWEAAEAGETQLVEDNNDPRLRHVINAMMRVMAPVGCPDEHLPIVELPVFGTEFFDELPRDHTVAAYREHLTQVAMVRAGKAAIEVCDGWTR